MLFSVGSLIESASFLQALFKEMEKMPETIRYKHTSGAKARIQFDAFAARLKSCPDTKPTSTGYFLNS
jgi:hypothetical protein